MTGSASPQQPYPGLRSFQRHEDLLFFGRDEHTTQLLDKLATNSFVAVLGSSGSGKSSLVLAGLLPALARGALVRAGASWQIAEFRPGEEPLARLAAALAGQTDWGKEYLEQPGATIAQLGEQLARGPMALKWVLGVRPLPEGTRLLLVVDQFEELFRFERDGAAAEARAFVERLLAAADHPDVYVVITMRSDFLGDCARMPGLAEAVNAGLYLTPQLTREQLAEAIGLPARMFEGEIETALVKHLLEEAQHQDDLLPLLQHALMRTWERDEDKVLTLPEYQRLGSLKQILDTHAEEAWAELDEDGRALGETLFRALTERGPDGRDVRHPCTLGEIAAIAEVAPEVLIPVVERFRAPGRNFLMPPPEQALGPETMLDITHEALIRQWDRLQGWTADEAEKAAMLRRLVEAEQRHAERKGALWIDPDLGLAIEWRDKDRPSANWAARYQVGLKRTLYFLRQSELQRNKEREAIEARREGELRRAQRTTVFAIIGFLVAVGLASWAYFEQQRAEEALAAAETARTKAETARTKSLKAQSRMLTGLSFQATAAGNTTNGILLALEALPDDMARPDRPYVSHAEAALYGAIFSHRELAVLRGHEGSVRHADFSPDGSRIVTASEDNTARLWEIGRA